MSSNEANTEFIQALKERIDALLKDALPYAEGYDKNIADIKRWLENALISLMEWAEVALEKPDDKMALEIARGNFLTRVTLLLQAIEKAVRDTVWETAAQTALVVLGGILRGLADFQPFLQVLAKKT
jgi:hypothetical protein